MIRPAIVVKLRLKRFPDRQDLRDREDLREREDREDLQVPEAKKGRGEPLEMSVRRDRWEREVPQVFKGRRAREAGEDLRDRRASLVREDREALMVPQASGELRGLQDLKDLKAR
jgi:hypothetical protein